MQKHLIQATRSKKIRIQVGPARDSEISGSYGCCVDLIYDKKGVAFSFKRVIWFPKSISKYEEIPPIDRTKAMPTYFITCSEWFLKANKISYEI